MMMRMRRRILSNVLSNRRIDLIFRTRRPRFYSTNVGDEAPATFEDMSQFTEDDYFDHKVTTSQEMKNAFQQVHKLGMLAAKGQTYFFKKRYFEALDCFKQIVQIQPDNINARMNISNIYSMHLSQYENAIEYLLPIVNESGEYDLNNLEDKLLLGRVYFQIATCYSKLKDHDNTGKYCDLIRELLASTPATSTSGDEIQLLLQQVNELAPT